MSNLTETWKRNTSETDCVIKCNHVSTDGQFDSDASVSAGTVHSERLFERGKQKCMFIVPSTDVTGWMMFVLMC